MTDMTPREIVHELDKHIIGQESAKRAVAIALRNRWRRMQLENELRIEITPKNILMIGPTGVGKTEIARRLARVANAPFIKVEATKFTEVGYVGRDVESIVRDLVEISIKLLREQHMKRVKSRAEEAAEEKILDILLPESNMNRKESIDNTRQVLRKKFREGKLDDREIEITLPMNSSSVEILSPPGMEEMTSQLQTMFSNMAQGTKKLRTMDVKRAFASLCEQEAAKMIDDDDIKAKALHTAEENGIVFIDEIDKVTKSTNGSGADVSREGVQRDLLPLIEGCTVTTKYGMLKTDHILFIASGAFHLTKPSDLIPELQGRLPIRVELSALSINDFERILTEPNASLSEQYKALLSTEGIELSLTNDGIKRIAELAWQVNDQTENIGARRLHTIMERLLEEASFEAADKGLEANAKIVVDSSYVDRQIGELSSDEDLSRFIL